MRISDWSSDVCSSDLIGCQRTPVADHLQLHVIGGKFVEVAEDEALHQPHQVADFRFGAFPVFRRKGVKRHRLDAELARSEEHTSELQSLMRISSAVFCLQQKLLLLKIPITKHNQTTQTKHSHHHIT